MKTTKNKTVKGIKILSNGSLYGALFISAGWACCGCRNAKEVRSLPYTTTKNANNLINTNTAADADDDDDDEIEETDEDSPDEGSPQGNVDNPAFRNSSSDENNPDEGSPQGGVDNPTFRNSSSDENNPDENNNVSQNPNLGKEYPESGQQPPVLFQAKVEKKDSSNKTLNEGKNGPTRSSNRSDKPKKNVNSKSQNITSDGSKNNNLDGKKATENNLKVDKRPLNNTNNHTKGKGSSQENTTNQDTSLNPDLKPLLEDLKSKIDRLNELQKIKNKKKVKKFLEEHNIDEVQKRIKNWPKDEQERHIQLLSKLADLRTND